MAHDHVPQVARLSSGCWGVYCSACSAAENNYVYPCKHPDAPLEWPADWPPPTLIARPREASDVTVEVWSQEEPAEGDAPYSYESAVADVTTIDGKVHVVVTVDD